jgi:hypothetical protein
MQNVVLGSVYVAFMVASGQEQWFCRSVSNRKFFARGLCRRSPMGIRCEMVRCWMEPLSTTWRGSAASNPDGMNR